MPGFGGGLDLEFLRSARARLISAGVAAFVLVVVAAWVSIPSIAEKRAKQQLERLGLSWTSEDRSMSLGGLRFDGVTITSKESAQQLAKLTQIELDLKWLRALSDPRAALSAVRIHGLTAEVDADELRRLRDRRSSSGATTNTPTSTDSARPLPTVHVEDAQLRLLDAQGVLVHAEIAQLALSSTSWEVVLDKAELGEASGEFVRIQGARAEGPLESRRPRLSRAVAESALLVWKSRDGEDDSAGLARRALDLRAALRKKRAESGPEASAESDDETVSLWTPDAKIELRNARVVDGSVTPQQPILEKLNLALMAEGAPSLRVKGEGLTATGGSLQWDLHVTPRDARVEGRVALKDVPLVLFAPVLPKLPFHELERTRVGADLAITGHGLQTASVRGELSISELAFASERLARAPVGPISFTARGEGTWTPARRELSGLSGELRAGEARVLVTGALAWPDDAYRVSLSAELPKTSCSAVLATVPSGLLDELASIQLGGDIKAKVDVNVDSAALDATKLDFAISDKCKFEALPEAMSVRRFERPFTHRVLEPDGTMFEMESGPGTPAWTPIEQISPFMIQGVVAHEDGRFFTHRGFAEAEIGAALARNLKARAFKFGASTITMQLVKNVFLHRDKLLSRKVQEALIVWWLEQQVDKKWLLELYLNVIEYGPGIYGIRNASVHYFGVLPAGLTPAQAAFLATILPNPKSYGEQYEKGTISDSTKRRVSSFLQHMRSRDRIDDEALTYGLEELSQFRFYDPGQPPPEPVPMRGSAQAPPFAMGTTTVVPTYVPGTLPRVEDGSFGVGY